MNMWYIYAVEYYTAVKKWNLQVMNWDKNHLEWDNLDPEQNITCFLLCGC